MTSTLTVPGQLEDWTFTAPDGVTMTESPDGHLNIAIDYTLADFDGQANGGSLINITATEPIAIDPSGTPNNNFDVGLEQALTMEITNDTGFPISGYEIGLENQGGEPTDVTDTHPHYAHFHAVTMQSLVDQATGQPNATIQLFAPGGAGAFGPEGNDPAPEGIDAPNGIIAPGATEDLVGGALDGGVVLHSEDDTPGPDGGNFTLFFVPSNLVGFKPLSGSDPTDPTAVVVGAFSPFTKFGLFDVNSTETITATLTTPYGTPQIVGNTNGGTLSGSGSTFTITGTASQIQTIINDLSINATHAGSITLAVNDASGTQVFSETITINPGVVAGSDTVDRPSAPLTKGQTVTPFAKAIVTDTAPTETLNVTIAVPAGYSTSSKTTLSGTAAQITTFLNSFSATAQGKGPGTITATVTNPDDSNKVGATFSFDGTAPGGSQLLPPTSAQITMLSTDTIQFYNDQKGNVSTAADASKLTGDLTGLSIDKPTLAQLLAAALQNDAGSNAGTLGTDLTDVLYGTINSDLHSQSANLSADLTAMIKETVAVGGTYHSLLGSESPAAALAQTVSQYHLTG